MSVLIISLIDYFQRRQFTRRVGAITTSLSSPLSRGRKTKLAGVNFRGNWLRPNSTPFPPPLSPPCSTRPFRPLCPRSLCSILFKRNLWRCVAGKRFRETPTNYEFQAIQVPGKQFPLLSASCVSISSFSLVSFSVFIFPFFCFVFSTTQMDST